MTMETRRIANLRIPVLSEVVSEPVITRQGGAKGTTSECPRRNEARRMKTNEKTKPCHTLASDHHQGNEGGLVNEGN